MPKIKLTHQNIKAMDTPKELTSYYDEIESGLILRLSKTGRKTFCFRYKLSGKRRRYTLGTFPAISLSEARKKVRSLKVKVNDGVDPQIEKKKRKYDTDPKTLHDVAAEFMDKLFPTLRPTTRRNYKRIYEVELLPFFGDYQMDDISKNEIISLLDKKAYKDGAPVMANKIRARLSRLFTFAMKRDLAKSNPVALTPKYDSNSSGRDRYYNADELQELWGWFDQFSPTTAGILKMLLITGQRKTETSKMKWENIQGDVWIIPASLAKNHSQHLVPLSDMALEVIEQMRPITGKSDYVFCSPKKENTPTAWLTRARKTIQDHSEVPDFRPHDLRRTVATYMAKLGVDRTVLGKILNHKGLSGDSQVTAIYDRHSYMKEKRQAMNRWSNYLKQILEGETEAKIHKLG